MSRERKQSDAHRKHQQIARWRRQYGAELVSVILATFEVGGRVLELAWVKRDGAQFRVADRSTDAFVWCSTYQAAHALFESCCEEAGRPTFRSVAEMSSRGAS